MFVDVDVDSDSSGHEKESITRSIAGCFVQAIDRFEKPFDIVWALMVKCSLCALLGQNDVLMQDTAKIIEISERHRYTARLGNGLSLRGLARSRLGELDAGIADTRQGMVLWRSRGIVSTTAELICWLCDLLVRAGRLDEASQLLDEADTLIIDTDEACALAECTRIRGRITACGNDLTGAVRLFEKAIAISQRQEARLFELRATTQLASVLARQGRAQAGEARLRASSTHSAPSTKSSILRLLEGAGGVAPIDSRLSAASVIRLAGATFMIFGVVLIRT